MLYQTVSMVGRLTAPVSLVKSVSCLLSVSCTISFILSVTVHQQVGMFWPLQLFKERKQAEPGKVA